MSKKNTLSRRRAATFVAALGMLVMSSGVALIVAASPAQAANKVNICHATSSDTNPYVFIQVDDDSVKLKGHLMHREDPNKRWKTDGSFNGVNHVADQDKPDIIGSFTDDQGKFHLMDGDVTAATCEAAEPPEVLTAVAEVEFQDPACENENVADLDITESNATHVTEGTVAPGEHVKITFTADEGAAFEEGAQTVFEHTFGEVEEPCGIVVPPTPVTPGDPTFVDPTCDTDADVILPEPTPVTEVPVPERSADLIDVQDIDGIHYVVSGDLVPGGTVDVDATALDGYEIAEGATTHWSHTFPEVGTCDAVNPPDDTETVATPTVVHAGLTSSGQDLRDEQGLALLVTGMIMMAAAGGLALRKSASTL